MSRKNLKITERTYTVLKEGKREMETWDSYLLRLKGGYTDE